MDLVSYYCAGELTFMLIIEFPVCKVGMWYDCTEEQFSANSVTAMRILLMRVRHSLQTPNKLHVLHGS